MKLFKVIYCIFIVCVAVLALLLIFSVFPIAKNYKLMVVQSGSMEPKIKLGSIVVVRPADEYKVDDVITFKNPKAPGRTTTHRIYEIKKEEERKTYITKGDANSAPDTEEVLPEDIVGKVLFAVPYLGYAVDAAKKPAGFVLLIVIPATMVIYSEAMKIKEEIVKIWQKRKQEKEEKKEEKS